MRSEYDTICTIKLDTEGLVIMAFNSEYALEHAAGTWWIIKCAQTPDRYTPPVPVNDSGAEIFRGFIGNKTAEEIAMQLASEYGMSGSLQHSRGFCPGIMNITQHLIGWNNESIIDW